MVEPAGILHRIRPRAMRSNAYASGGADTELFSGTTSPIPDPDADTPAQRDESKFRPDVDPDERLRLHPTTHHLVASQQPTYPLSAAGKRTVTGFFAGLLGTAVMTAIIYILLAGRLIGSPDFVLTERNWLGPHNLFVDYALGTLGFLIAGGIWGGLFCLLVPRPSIAKGILFGIVPTVFHWLMAPIMLHQPLFLGFKPLGILLPILFNVFIWGAVTGYYAARWLRPPYSVSVQPT